MRGRLHLEAIENLDRALADILLDGPKRPLHIETSRRSSAHGRGGHPRFGYNSVWLAYAGEYAARMPAAVRLRAMDGLSRRPFHSVRSGI